MEAEAPPGNTIGGIRSDYAIALHQWFSIIDGSGQTVLKITRSTGNFFSPEVDFKVCTYLMLLATVDQVVSESVTMLLVQILSADATTEVGVITRQYAGFMKALFNFEAQHTFGITCKLSRVYLNIIVKDSVNWYTFKRVWLGEIIISFVLLRGCPLLGGSVFIYYSTE